MTQDEFKKIDELYKTIKELDFMGKRLLEVAERTNIDTASIVISIDQQNVNVPYSFDNRVLFNFLKETIDSALKEARSQFEQL